MASIRARPGRDGQVRYAVLYRDDTGRQRSQTFRRKRDATTLKNKVERDKDLGTFRDPRVARVLLRDYARTWLAGKHKTTKPASVKAYTNAIEGHVLPVFGHRAIGSIRRDEIRAWVYSLEYAPRTVKGIYGVLREVMSEAVRDGILAESPCRGIKLPKVERHEVVPLTMDQVRALTFALPPRYRALVTLGVASGLRVGEATGLVLDALDCAAVEVRATLVGSGRDYSLGTPKTASSRRTVPVPASAMRVLRGHVDVYGTNRDGLIFHTEDARPLTSEVLSRVWQPAVEDAGLPDGTTFHALRHTYASILIEDGLSPKVIQARLGHASIAETMDTYGHLYPSADDRTRDALSRALTKAGVDTTLTQEVE